MIATILVAWAIFAPMELGGGVKYVIVDGNSMLPSLKRGDLVLARKAPFYQIGDIIAYRYPELGTVIHRIIRQESSRFVTQGDHNTWQDSYRPEYKDIYGKVWVSIPNLGTIFARAKTPWIFALFVGLSTLLIGWTYMQPEPPKNRRLPKALMRLPDLTQPLSHQIDIYQTIIYLLGILSLILAVFAFLKPAYVDIPDNIEYQHRGFFGYAATAPATVYENGRLESGAAIFPGLTCQVDLTFIYLLDSPFPSTVKGNYQLIADVSSNSGWHRSFALQSPGTFSGTTLHTRAQLDVCKIIQTIQALESITGVHNFQYALTIYPNLHIRGQIEGKNFEDIFSPPLKFVVESNQIYLLRSENNSDPLQPVVKATLPRSRVVTNTLPIFALQLPVPVARWLAGLGLLIAALGLVIPAYLAKRAEGSDEPLLARLTFGSRLVEIGAIPQNHNLQVIPVLSLDDLDRLAERLNETIFFYHSKQESIYFVQNTPLLYQFRKPNVTLAVIEPLKHEIEKALAENQLTIYYQPVISLNNGTITQIEALLRWWHPEKSLILPADFLPGLEEAGLLPLVDRWVLHQIGRQIEFWRENNLPLYPVAVNLSGQTLSSKDFLEEFTQILQDHAIAPEYIQIEIREESLRDNPQALRVLQSMSNMGISITIDIPLLDSVPDATQANVNIGRVKLGYQTLRQIDVHTLTDAPALEWISTAHARQIRVTAVGVETTQQLKFLRMNACDEAQGFLISPPLPAEDIHLYLQQRLSLITMSFSE